MSVCQRYVVPKPEILFRCISEEAVLIAAIVYPKLGGKTFPKQRRLSNLR